MARKAAGTKVGASKSGQTADSLTPYIEVGRTNQKLRTRDALVDVAVDMIRRGQQISVSEVADAARVSRTTAYRYFPTTEMLAAQATLVAANLIEARHIQEIFESAHSPDEKLDELIVGIHEMTAANEASFRSLVRFTVEARPQEGEEQPRRTAFRRVWLEGALNDLRKDLGPARFSRLTAALSLMCGIESIIVLNDLCNLTPQDALKVKRWAAQRLLEATIAEVGPSDPAQVKTGAATRGGAAKARAAKLGAADTGARRRRAP